VGASYEASAPLATRRSRPGSRGCASPRRAGSSSPSPATNLHTAWADPFRPLGAKSSTSSRLGCGLRHGQRFDLAPRALLRSRRLVYPRAGSLATQSRTSVGRRRAARVEAEGRTRTRGCVRGILHGSRLLADECERNPGSASHLRSGRWVSRKPGSVRWVYDHSWMPQNFLECDRGRGCHGCVVAV
jgi:hypothetical protein